MKLIHTKKFDKAGNYSRQRVKYKDKDYWRVKSLNDPLIWVTYENKWLLDGDEWEELETAFICMNKEKTHPLAGKIVRIKDSAAEIGGCMFEVEDYWHHPMIGNGSWTVAKGNPGCLSYAVRIGNSKEYIPADDEVLYGVVQGKGKYLVHVSEIEGAAIKNTKKIKKSGSLTELFNILGDISKTSPEHEKMANELIGEIKTAVEAEASKRVNNERPIRIKFKRKETDQPELINLSELNIDDYEDLASYQQALKDKRPLGKYVRQRMNELDITEKEVQNICDIEESILIQILSDMYQPYIYPMKSLAKLFVLLNIKRDELFECMDTIHQIKSIDLIQEWKLNNVENENRVEVMLEAEKMIMEIKKEMEIYMEDMADPYNALIDQYFHQQSIKKIKRDRLKEQLRKSREGKEIIIKDPLKDQLAPIVPGIIAGKTTDDYLSEIQHLRERLATYGTFGMAFKKSLDANRFEAPALERRFGFKAAHTKALLIDEFYPDQIDIKPFVRVCKFLNFQIKTLIPQLENTFLLLQLKNMEYGTTKDKLEKLSNLTVGEKRNWDHHKRKHEAWLKRLVPVIAHTLT